MPRINHPPKYPSNAAQQKAYRARKDRSEMNAKALVIGRDLLKVERPVLSYYGGKWRIAKWIIAQFPPHICYVEPYCGAGSVMMQKKPSQYEVLNDLDRDLINFFDMLRTRPADMIHAIALTPYAREEYYRACRPTTSTDRIELARRYYVRIWQAYASGSAKRPTGWRVETGSGSGRAKTVSTFNKTRQLWQAAARLKQIQIDNRPALKVIEIYDAPTTLFYVDPPYTMGSRTSGSHLKGYQHEMTDLDHKHLAALIHQCSGMFIVSGYRSPLYDSLYADFTRIDKATITIDSRPRIESVWLSPSVLNHQTPAQNRRFLESAAMATTTTYSPS